MSTLVGNNAYVTVSGTTIVAAMAEWSISDSKPAVVVEKFSEIYSSVPGMSYRTVTGMVSGYYDPADVTGQVILYDNYIAGTAVPGLRLYLDDNNYYCNTGGIYIENYNTNVAVGGIIAVDFTFVASGDWILTTGSAPVQGDTAVAAIIEASTNNRVARYNGTNNIQGSLVTIDDSGNIITAGNMTGTSFYGDGSNLTGISGTPNHSELNELDYASAGHTGFQPAGEYVTDEEMTTISGDLVAQIAPGYVTDAEMTTISGDLQTNIDAKPDTLLELTDTPALYSDGLYLRSTAFGTEWDTVSGAGGTSNHSELNELDYASSGHTGFQASGDYVTDAEVTTTSGDIVDQIPTDFYSTSEITTISGDIISYVDVEVSAASGTTTLIGLTDTPSGYNNGLYLKSTTDGTEWTTASGPTGPAGIPGLPGVFAIRGNHQLQNDSNLATVPLGTTLADADYVVMASIKNIVDTNPAIFDFVVTAATTDWFSIELNGTIDSTNYYLDYTVIPAFGAGYYTLLELTDTPISYNDGLYLRSTASGSEWSDVDHDQLTNYVVGQHRVITDSGTGTTDLWSAEKIAEAITTATGSLTVNHSELNELDYASAGHTGFQPTGDYATNTQLTTTSGDIVSQIPDVSDFITDAEVTTISGDIVDQIPVTAEDITYSTKTVDYALDKVINCGVLGDITISNPTGLTINWSSGTVFTNSVGTIVDTVSGTDTATDNAINYLIWVSGNTLSLGTTIADVESHEITIGTMTIQDGTVYGICEYKPLRHRESVISDGFGKIFSTLVTSGLIVSEDLDVTNALDVVSTAGTFFHDGYNEIDVAQINTRTTPMVRHFKTSGAWDSDTNAEIDTAYYNDGTDLAAAGNKWYKSLFIVGATYIHWVYPITQYNTTAQALAAPLPPKPPGLEKMPNSVSLVYQGGDIALPGAGDEWEDVRPMIGATGTSASVSDHGNLLGLSDDDHAHYHNDTRGDARYYLQSEVTTISGDIVAQLYTDEESQDAVGNIIVGVGSVSVNYDDGTPQITISGAAASVSGANHSELSELDYASAGHTGFQPAGNYVTDSEMTTISGDIVSQIPSGYITDAEMTTISGDIITQVDEKWPTWSGTIDHNTILNYEVGEHRTINDSGTGTTDLWSANKINNEIGSLTINHSELNELDYSLAGHTGFQPAGNYLVDIVEDTSPELGGDLNVNTKKIISNAGQNIFIEPGLTFFIDINDNYNNAMLIREGAGGSTIMQFNTANGSEAIYMYKPFGFSAVGTTITEFSTDGTFVGDSDNAVPTEKAVKTYVDASFDHGLLTGLLDDDHTQYLLRTDFTTSSGDIVAQFPSDFYTQAEVTTISGDIIAQRYTNEEAQDAVGPIMYGAGGTSVVYDDIGNTITISGATASGVISDHGVLDGLGDDDHTQYIPVDGARGFTSTISGVDPTESYHLATKDYADNVSGGSFTEVKDDTSPQLGGDLDVNNFEIVSATGHIKINPHLRTLIYLTAGDVTAMDIGGLMQFDTQNSRTIIGPHDYFGFSTSGVYIEEFSTDGTLAGNSDTAVPTEKAVKTYLSSGAGTIVAADHGTATDEEVVNVIYGTGDAPTTSSGEYSIGTLYIKYTA